MSTPPSAVSSARISSFFQIQPTKIEVRIPRTGSITIAVKLSSNAKRFIPTTLNSLHAPSDNEQVVESNSVAMVTTVEPALRLIPRFSTKYDVTASCIEIVDDNAARPSKRKKSVAHRLPKGIDEKTLGIATNASCIPLSFSTPAEKMITAAVSATTVSSDTTLIAVPAILVPPLKYQP